MTEHSISAGNDSGQEDVLSLFGAGLQVKVKKACTERLEIERRWVEDMRQYFGQYDAATLSNMPEGGSRVFVNLTRPKTDKGEAQIVDMLFPADDKNYGISPTPNPEMAAATTSDEQVYDQNGTALQFADDKAPLTEADVAKAHMELAEEAAKKMEREIDDQLIECDYSASCRKAVHYAAVLGTGVLCGPEVELREQSVWSKDSSGAFVHEFKTDKRPVVRHVPTWDFFPDMSATSIQECNYVFERSYMSRKTLRNLKRVRGINEKNLQQLLEDTKDGGGKSTQNHSDHVNQLRQMSGIISQTEDNRYEVWRYRGPIEKSVLISAGVVDAKDEAVPSEIDGIVIFCGDKVLKAAINPMNTEDWPYAVFCWNKDDNCIFGTGIPHDARQEQAIINTSVRLMLDNATKSAGPQILRDHRVRPEDGKFTITPWKIWNKTDPSLKAEDAFRIFTFPSLQNEIANIYQLAKALFDEVTGIPAISQGEQGQVTETYGGMSLLMNAAGTTRRNQVKHFDDDVTVPMIKRFYDWNMQYNPKQEIKGDMKVYARGTSALLAKEQNSQALFNILNNYVGHPVLSKFFKDEGLDAFRMAIQSLHINPDDLVKDKDTYAAELKQQQEEAQQNPPQEDPRIVAAKIAAESKANSDQASQQMHTQTNETNLQIANGQMHVELVKYASAEKVSIEKASLDFKKAGMKLDLDKSMFTSELQLKQTQGETANYGLGDSA